MSDSTQTREASAALERLNVFVGKWHTEGEQHAGPMGPAAPVSAVETYEWLSGEHFLVHRFEGHVGKNDASCIEIIGHDVHTHRYPVHTFYNNGVSNEWEYREHAGVWTLSGSWSIAGKKHVPVRCTITFEDEAATLHGKWEYAADGGAWQTFWDVKATKQPPIRT